LDACFLKRGDRFDIARKRCLHIDQSTSINPIIFDDGFLGVVEMVHVSAKHQSRAAAAPL
jgi:hypothetical protein